MCGVSDCSGGNEKQSFCFLLKSLRCLLGGGGLSKILTYLYLLCTVHTYFSCAMDGHMHMDLSLHGSTTCVPLCSG